MWADQTCVGYKFCLKACDLGSPSLLTAEWRTIVPASGGAVRFAWGGRCPWHWQGVASKCMLELDSRKHGARLQDAEPVGLMGMKAGPIPRIFSSY